MRPDYLNPQLRPQDLIRRINNLKRAVRDLERAPMPDVFEEEEEGTAYLVHVLYLDNTEADRYGLYYQHFIPTTRHGYVFHLSTTGGGQDAARVESGNRGGSWGREKLLTTDKSIQVIDVWYDKWTPGATPYPSELVSKAERRVTPLDFVSTDGGQFNFDNRICSITRAQSGRLYAAARSIDEPGTSTVSGFYASDDAGKRWRELTSPFTGDHDNVLLFPNAGNGCMAIYWDRANFILQRKVFNGSSWSTTTIATDMHITAEQDFHHMSAAVRQPDGAILLAAYEGMDDMNTEPTIRTWEVTASSITEKASHTDGFMRDLGVTIDQAGTVNVVYIEEVAEELRYVSSSDGMATWTGPTTYTDEGVENFASGVDAGTRSAPFYPVWVEFLSGPDSMYGKSGSRVTVTATGAGLIAESMLRHVVWTE